MRDHQFPDGATTHERPPERAYARGGTVAEPASDRAGGLFGAVGPATAPYPPPPPPGGGFGRFLAATLRRIATLLIAAVAVVVALAAWQYYVRSPWTRNGAVRVQVANVAPQVSGQIVNVAVADNAFVHAGDILYVIDPSDYEAAVRIAEASVAQMAADLQVKDAESTRRQKLSNLATTAEEQQLYAGTALQAKAAYDGANQQLDLARLNLGRTTVRSPVNGYVTNLLLRVGDYAVEGESNVSVVDADSYWVDGYFEETKLPGICVGDRAEAKLMSYAEPIVGHVTTITRGISVGNAGAGPQGLPDVDPVYTWVRLAQRVPVRIAIDTVPSGVPLISGMTATVTIRRAAAPDERPILERARAAGLALLTGLLDGPPAPDPACLTGAPGAATPERIPVPAEPPIPAPSAVDPGLVPGITSPPAVR